MDAQALFDGFKNVVTEHYVDFEGRAARTPFWHYVLVYIVIYIALAIVDRILWTGALRGLYSLALFLPTLGITVRRLHDTGKSGWWALLMAVPAVISILAAISFFIGALGALLGLFLLFGTLLPIAGLAALAALIYLCAQPGTPGPNQYGPDPMGGAATAPAS